MTAEEKLVENGYEDVIIFLAIPMMMLLQEYLVMEEPYMILI